MRDIVILLHSGTLRKREWMGRFPFIRSGWTWSASCQCKWKTVDSSLWWARFFTRRTLNYLVNEHVGGVKTNWLNSNDRANYNTTSWVSSQNWPVSFMDRTIWQIKSDLRFAYMWICDMNMLLMHQRFSSSLWAGWSTLVKKRRRNKNHV